MTFARPLPGFITILATSLIAPQAQARDNRPDDNGYPCAAHGRLTIVQDDQGYSIRNTIMVQEAKPILAAAIVIGDALKIDASIFALTARAPREVSNAPRR